MKYFKLLEKSAEEDKYSIKYCMNNWEVHKIKTQEKNYNNIKQFCSLISIVCDSDLFHNEIKMTKISAKHSFGSGCWFGFCFVFRLVQARFVDRRAA